MSSPLALADIAYPLRHATVPLRLSLLVPVLPSSSFLPTRANLWTRVPLLRITSSSCPIPKSTSANDSGAAPSSCRLFTPAAPRLTFRCLCSSAGPTPLPSHLLHSQLSPSLSHSSQLHLRSATTPRLIFPFLFLRLPPALHLPSSSSSSSFISSSSSSLEAQDPSSSSVASRRPLSVSSSSSSSASLSASAAMASSGEANTGVVVVYVTVPDKATGQALASSIIQNKLAACVNRVPGVESTYFWEGKVTTDAEELLIIKTRQSLLDQLSSHVKANHPYSLPEFIALPVVGGSEGYLKWVVDNTKKP